MGKDGSQKPPPLGPPEDTGTSVDLGDDLLVTKTVTRQQQTEIFSSRSSPKDQYDSARILISEGLIEDAKKLLRRILIDDPHHAAASESLRGILDREMKDLLVEGSAPRRPRIFERAGKGERGPQPTGENVLRELDDEFGLGILGEEAESSPVPKIEGDLSEASADDRMDLGIAFMEMGLNEAAIGHFRAALDMLGTALEPDRPRMHSAMALLGRAYLATNQPFEAIRLLHPILRDAEVPGAEKIEFFYLMGLSQEMAGGRKAALPWFAKVRDLDPRYRDIAEKLRKPSGGS